MKNVLKELNKPRKEYVVMTKDRRCILRGTAATGYVISLTTEKNKKKIRICCSTAPLGIDNFTRCTEGVVKLYNLKSDRVDNKLADSLEYVRIYHQYSFE